MRSVHYSCTSCTLIFAQMPFICSNGKVCLNFDELNVVSPTYQSQWDQYQGVLKEVKSRLNEDGDTGRMDEDDDDDLPVCRLRREF